MLRAGREQVCQEGLTYPFCSKYHTSITLSIKNSSEICIVICGEAREYGFTDLERTGRDRSAGNGRPTLFLDVWQTKDLGRVTGRGAGAEKETHVVNA